MKSDNFQSVKSWFQNVKFQWEDKLCKLAEKNGVTLNTYTQVDFDDIQKDMQLGKLKSYKIEEVLQLFRGKPTYKEKCKYDKNTIHLPRQDLLVMVKCL